MGGGGMNKMVGLNSATSVITVSVNETNTSIRRQISTDLIKTIHNYLLCTRNTL